MREAGHHRRAEETGQPLQRVNGAKDVVDELGVTAAAPADVVEREEIATETVDDLLGLGEELLARLFSGAVARASSGVLSHGWDPLADPVPGQGACRTPSGGSPA